MVSLVRCINRTEVKASNREIVAIMALATRSNTSFIGDQKFKKGSGPGIRLKRIDRSHRIPWHSG